MNSNPIVGIVGMPGSGKSVLTEMFCERGWNKVYFGSVTLNELDKRKLEHTEQNEKKVREELRCEYGEDAYARYLLPDIIRLSNDSPLVLDGLYSWPEYKLLKESLNDRLKILAVITNSQIRYNRLSERKKRPLSMNQAISRDHAEIERLSKGGPIAIADYYITNNSTLDEYRRQFEVFVKNEAKKC